MFRPALEQLFEQQRLRLTSVSDPDTVNKAFEFLGENRLDVDSIDYDCCEELKLVLNKRYDVPMDRSTRLEKHGWSIAHIQEHMRRFLQKKMKTVGKTLKAFLDNDIDDQEPMEKRKVSADEPEDTHYDSLEVLQAYKMGEQAMLEELSYD